MDINGHVVRKLWIEQASDIEREYYLSVTFDRGEKKALFMLTKEGGIDIEEVASERPEAFARLHVDPLEGFQPYQARRLIYAAGIEDPERAEADPRDRPEALRRVRRRGRDALRDQPVDRHARGRGQGARLEVHGRRQRALQASGHRGDARSRGVPARGARRAREGRHLREARRRGRDPRQRSRPGHVHAGRDRARRRQARELLRPRWRRRRAGRRRRARDHQRRPAGEVDLLQHLRRDHTLRRRRAGDAARRSTRRGSSIRSSSASTARTPPRGGRSSRTRGATTSTSRRRCSTRRSGRWSCRDD